jgi:AraC-like DNA-binding protein
VSPRCCYNPSVKLDLPREREFEGGVWYSTRASTWYPNHHHDELEVKLVLWGRTRYRIGAAEVELGPGSLLWLAPGQEHALLTVSDDLAMWVASFRNPTVLAAEVAADTRVLDQRRGWGACVLPPAQVRELSTLHTGLVHCEEPALVNPRARHLLASALLGWREHGRERAPEPPFARRPGNPLHAAVARARELLCDIDADLPLAILARRCGLDAARLSRVFKQQMGLSIVQFRNHFRIQQFIARLGRGDGRNMLQVALDSGFGSYPQFHRAFHQVTSYAPSEHLRRVRAGVVFPTQQLIALPGAAAP